MNSRLAELAAAAPQPQPSAADLLADIHQRAAEHRAPPPPQPQAPPQRHASIVSAPVSREVPTGSGNGIRSPGRITLTPEEKAHALLAGVTEAEYAKQKLRLAELKARGEYSEAR